LALGRSSSGAKPGWPRGVEDPLCGCPDETPRHGGRDAGREPGRDAGCDDACSGRERDAGRRDAGCSPSRHGGATVPEAVGADAAGSAATAGVAERR
jgi:hypothetical protein